jgi:hypothetical protein
MKAWRRIVLPVLALVAAGCGGDPDLSPPPSQADAKQVLTQALDAWKGGGAAEALVAGQPPLRMLEPEWTAGSKLLDYQIADAGAPTGNSFNLRTKLTIQRPMAKGKETLNVVYIVTTGQPLSIVRE